MANEKNKIKELVSDDEDPTAELEVITFADVGEFAQVVERESDTHTFGLDEDGAEAQPADQSIAELRSDLQSRAKTIGRLQHDMEQLRSKWLGLETEIKAREAIVGKLSQDIDDLRDTVSRKEKLLKKRDTTIRALKQEIRQREEAHRELARHHAELQASWEQPPENTAVDTAPEPGEWQAQLSRTEQYADDLRIKLKDLVESHDDLNRDRDRLTRNLAQATESNQQLTADLATSARNVDQLQAELDDLRKTHEEEIRILRFELDEAQSTIAETSDLNSQLASDLMDTRGYKDELERKPCDNEEKSQRSIEKLEHDLNQLARSAEDYEQKLESKSTAINVLLSELAKKSEQIEAIGEIEDVIQDIDDRMSERIDDIDDVVETGPRQAGKERDKVTRVLIGRIGDQVLRFPLFKDRLTIGRTEDNDIQLKLSYISRRHAVVMTEGETTRVIDWGSKNGVYVNSKRIKEHFLSNGDIVAVGNAKFRYEERRKRES